jgi:hypothetical protein
MRAHSCSAIGLAGRRRATQRRGRPSSIPVAARTSAGRAGPVLARTPHGTCLRVPSRTGGIRAVEPVAWSTPIVGGRGESSRRPARAWRDRVLFAASRCYIQMLHQSRYAQHQSRRTRRFAMSIYNSAAMAGRPYEYRRRPRNHLAFPFPSATLRHPPPGSGQAGTHPQRPFQHEPASRRRIPSRARRPKLARESTAFGSRRRAASISRSSAPCFSLGSVRLQVCDQPAPFLVPARPFPRSPLQQHAAPSRPHRSYERRRRRLHAGRLARHGRGPRTARYLGTDGGEMGSADGGSRPPRSLIHVYPHAKSPEQLTGTYPDVATSPPARPFSRPAPHLPHSAPLTGCQAYGT